MTPSSTRSISSAGPQPLIVGIGSGAGGVDAFCEFLKQLGTPSNLILVLVRHLVETDEDKLHQAIIDARLHSVSITGRTKLKPGTLYLATTEQLLEMKNGGIRPLKSESDENIPTAIDSFFYSLATDQADHAVGIILSGAGTDGTLGLKAISDGGGLTFAQQAESARYDSMPRSAAITGVADHVCAPTEIANELLHYAKHFHHHATGDEMDRVRRQIGESIPQITERLLKITGNNFRHYKTTTLIRRIQRRMQLLKIPTAQEYVDLLMDGDAEPNGLFRELLIGVTAFFRDPEVFDALAMKVVPKILDNRRDDEPIRIWVAGCSTGEEAYSLAILFHELIEKFDRNVAVQIFATDIDEQALKIARAGIYPSGIEDHISPERLKRFFIRRGKRYQVGKSIREQVLFSKHNLISDPPFSRQDLISCRNLLIYLGSHLQKKLVPLFHYSLRPNGFLVLGPSESISSHGELFRALDNKSRISERKGTAAVSVSVMPLRKEEDAGTAAPSERTEEGGVDLTIVRQRILLDEFTPRAAIIDQRGKVLNSSDGIGKYLKVAEGDFENNIFKMVSADLRVGLRTAFKEATETRRKATYENVSIRAGEDIQRMMLTVQPMPQLGKDEELFLVVFHDIGSPIPRSQESSETSLLPDIAISQGERHADAIISQLERELETTRSSLERALQDMEATNEELKSSNEELLSMNEELQSANEELETSKEEIRISSDAIARAHSDLENLLQSIQIATIFMDDDYTIRSFTPNIREVYGLIETDLGRSLTLFAPMVDEMPPLPTALEVPDVGAIEHTFQTRAGNWYLRRVLAYRNSDKKRDGLLATFVDMTLLVESERRMAMALDATSDGSWDWNLLTGEVRFSDSWLLSLGYQRSELSHSRGFWKELIHPEDLERVEDQLNQHLAGASARLHCEHRLRKQSGEYRWNLLRGQVVERDRSNNPKRMVGTDTDIGQRKQIEMELNARRRQLKTITDAIPPLIAFVNLKRNYEFVNAGYAKHFGRPVESILGHHVAEIVGEELYEKIDPHLTRALNGERVTFEVEITRPDDTLRIFEAMYTPERDESGMVQGVHVVTHDVTEKSIEKKQLADQNLALQSVIDNMLGFLGVLDTMGRLQLVNQRALDAGGLQRQEVIGKPFWECYWWAYDQAIAQELQDCFQRACQGERIRYDVLVRMAGESRMMIDFMMVPIFNASGELTEIVVSGMDISQRKKAEQEMRRVNAKLGVLFEQSPAFIGILDRHGRLTDVNKTATKPWNLEPHQLIDVPFWETRWWSGQAESQERLREMFPKCWKGATFNIDMNYTCPDDSTGVVDFYMTPALSDDGTILFLVAHGLDVSKQRANEKEVQEARKAAESANEAKSSFLANMSHEIRTPMTAILGYVELIREKVSAKELLEPLDIIRRNGDYLLEIINDILDLSKIEVGKLGVEHERFEPARLVEDVRSIMQVRAKERGLDLKVHYDGKVPNRIVSDGKRLKQILVNLVGNAIKFTQKGGVGIRLHFDHESQTITFDVTDTGIGISDEQKQRLFQAFSQADSSVSRVFGGTGLGLAISKRLAQMLDGDIIVTSTLGKGSSFKLVVPARGTENAQYVEYSDGFNESLTQNSLGMVPMNFRKLRCHVMVVDDRRDIRMLSKTILTNAGASVEECEDGQIAVERIEEYLRNGKSPDLILLDMQMPNLDGYETARKLRSIGYKKPIIALTADAMHGDMDACIRAGCDDYLSKPIDRNLLIEMVRNKTTRKGLARES